MKTKSRFALARCLAAFAALWICGNLYAAAQVRAWLDRADMTLGETVTLNVEVSGDTRAAPPDFSALRGDFDLLGTQSSTQMNIVNGQTSAKLIWAVGLQPKHEGTLKIPALEVAGAQTQPLTLQVAAASASASKPGGDVFVEVNVEPASPYVQQQMRATVKLYYAVNLTDGSLDDLRGEGLTARKLGQESSYIANVEGRQYHVLERHYALVAEKSGDLTVAPVQFRGHAIDPNDVNSFFNRGRIVSATAAATPIRVRPRPAASGSDAWLPAQSLTLSADGLDAATQGRIGEPLTLTVHLKAQGLSFEQLPELALPKIDGADVYPDKEETQNGDDGTWQYGERTRKFAIVPNRAGTLTIPALHLDWWDTQHDRAAAADVPLRRVEVLAAAGATAAAGAASGAASPAAQTAPATLPSSPTAAVSSSPAALPGAETALWRALALGAFVLWGVTALGWFAQSRRRRRNAVPAPSAEADSADPASLAQARKRFEAACAHGDLSAAAQAVLAWARAQGANARTLGDLALSDEAQRAALAAAGRVLYGGASDDGALARLAAAFRAGPALAPRGSGAAADSVLPPLYPHAVR